MEFGHYASPSNISAYMQSILITRSLRSQLPRAVPVTPLAAPFQRRAVPAVWHAWGSGGEVSVNRTSADIIPLYSASVRTKSSASHVMTLLITSRADCWPLPSENRRRSNRKDRDFDPIRSPCKIAISISISMIVTALLKFICALSWWFYLIFSIAGNYVATSGSVGTSDTKTGSSLLAVWDVFYGASCNQSICISLRSPIGKFIFLLS